MHSPWAGGVILVAFAVLALILAGQLIIVSWGGEVFRTVPLSWQDWLLIIGPTSVVMWVG